MQQANWISLGIIVTLFHVWCRGWCLPWDWPYMPLQLPAGILWCSLGSASHMCPLLGLYHGLTMRRGVSWWGAQCSFGTASSLEEKLCQAGTSWSSLPYQPRGIPSGGLASHGRSELPPDWLLLTQSRWPSLHSHLGQLLGWQWWQQPSHILQPSCFLHPPLCLFHLLLLCCGWGLSSWGWVVYCQSSPHLLGMENPPLPAPLVLLWGHFHPSHSITQIGRCQPMESSMTSFSQDFA